MDIVKCNGSWHDDGRKRNGKANLMFSFHVADGQQDQLLTYLPKRDIQLARARFPRWGKLGSGHKLLANTQKRNHVAQIAEHEKPRLSPTSFGAQRSSEFRVRCPFPSSERTERNPFGRKRRLWKLAAKRAAVAGWSFPRSLPVLLLVRHGSGFEREGPAPYYLCSAYS